jgi:hypothetical protein
MQEQERTFRVRVDIDIVCQARIKLGAAPEHVCDCLTKFQVNGLILCAIDTGTVRDLPILTESKRVEGRICCRRREREARVYKKYEQQTACKKA